MSTGLHQDGDAMPLDWDERPMGRHGTKLTPAEVLAARVQLALDILTQALGAPIPTPVRPPIQTAVVALRQALGLCTQRDGDDAA